jgi:hypothetical protein
MDSEFPVSDERQKDATPFHLLFFYIYIISSFLAHGPPSLPPHII